MLAWGLLELTFCLLLLRGGVCVVSIPLPPQFCVHSNRFAVPEKEKMEKKINIQNRRTIHLRLMFLTVQGLVQVQHT